ncbi:MAG: hypothetical protein QOJ15_6008 [Bradyrhizobium sp.]|jgi:transcriptional regulator with XRE-family HTH domain|nr:hypothetical protein [Bradyrhizobium sp.]
MSQSAVGTAVGLTFQQIQKYERGSNRIGSSRLFEFAKVLDVPVSYFFDEMPSNALSGRGRKGFGEAGTPFEQEKDPLIKRETLELVRAYYKVRESRVRKRHLRDGQGGGRRQPCRGAGRPQGTQNPARFQLMASMDDQGCGYFEIGKPAGFAMLPPSSRRMVGLERMLGRQASNKP